VDGGVRLTLEDVPAADSGEEDDRLGCDNRLIHVFLLDVTEMWRPRHHKDATALQRKPERTLNARSG
jgi:hypothetical protein